MASDIQRALRAVIRAELLHEAAVAPAAAVTQHLALMDTLQDGQRMLVLYDPGALDRNLRDGDSTNDAVKGFITLRLDSQTGHYVVSQSAAVHGFGPLMYDAALSLGRYVMPDENGSVTPDAQRVWQHYAVHRKAEIETATVSIDRGHTVAWLNAAYRLKSPKKLAGLRMAHRIFTAHNRRSRADLEHIIGVLGVWLFNTSYKLQLRARGA